MSLKERKERGRDGDKYMFKKTKTRGEEREERNETKRRSYILNGTIFHFKPLTVISLMNL